MGNQVVILSVVSDRIVNSLRVTACQLGRECAAGSRVEKTRDVAAVPGNIDRHVRRRKQDSQRRNPCRRSQVGL